MSSKYAPHFSRVAKICNMASLEWMMQVSKHFAFLSSKNVPNCLKHHCYSCIDDRIQIHINIDWKNYAAHAVGALLEASISSHIVKETSYFDLKYWNYTSMSTVNTSSFPPACQIKFTLRIQGRLHNNPIFNLCLLWANCIHVKQDFNIIKEKWVNCYAKKGDNAIVKSKIRYCHFTHKR